MDVLTLAMKEQIRQFDVAFRDAPEQPWYCGDCLANLPADEMLHGSHVCGEAFPVERAFGGLGQEIIGPEPGAVVWFSGEIPPGYGRVYEVGTVTTAGLYLYDVLPAPGRRLPRHRHEHDPASRGTGCGGQGPRRERVHQ